MLKSFELLMSRVFLAGVTAFSALSFAWAKDDCSTISNLAANAGPPHKQHCTNWCFNFVATDLMTQKLQRTGQLKRTERLHPIAMAGTSFLMHGRDPGSSTKEGWAPNYVFEAVNKAMAKGDRLCKETDLGAETGPENELFRESSEKAANVIREGLPNPAADVCRLGQMDENQNANMGKLLESASKASKQAWVDILHNKNCRVTSPKIEWWNYYNDARWEELNAGKAGSDPDVSRGVAFTIDKALSEGKMAGVLMNFKVLQDPNAPRSAEGEQCRQSMKDTGVNLHWLSVIGRRRDAKGVCQYQLRNSTGKSCARLLHPENCKDGSIWVPKDQLINNSAGAQYVL